MKKIYTAPDCELLGTITTEILATSNSFKLNLDKGLQDDFKYGGEDTNGEMEADANQFTWDHFDNGLK